MSMSKDNVQWVLRGEEYLADRHIARLLNSWVDENIRDFNYDRVSAKERSASDVMNIMQTPPMMTDYRVVCVEDLDAWKKTDFEILGRYFSNPNPDCRILFVSQKADKRTKFYKSFQKQGTLNEFKKLYPNQVPEVLVKEAKASKIKLSPQAAFLLVESLGTNINLLMKEVEKLSLYVQEGESIEKSHVQLLTGQGLVENVWELGGVLGKRDLAKAQDLVERMIEQGESVIRIVSLISGHFRKLLLTREYMGLTGSSRPQTGLDRILGVPQFFVKDYEGQAKRFQLRELKTAYENLMQLSVNLRQLRVHPEVQLGHFLQSVCLKTA